MTSPVEATADEGVLPAEIKEVARAVESLAANIFSIPVERLAKSAYSLSVLSLKMQNEDSKELLLLASAALMVVAAISLDKETISAEDLGLGNPEAVKH